MDLFNAFLTKKSDPADGARLVSPSDSVDLPIAARGLSCATSGDIAVVTLRGETVTLYVAAGAIFPQRVTRVLSTGTTATRILAHY